ncbi:hypothetical protein KJA13_01470 [Patescibacteria group bacterium]|nr:hypothetical protein [Patescibacteria group bacterium]
MNGYFCKECNHRKWLYEWLKINFCFYCKKKTPNNVNITVSDKVSIKDNVRIKIKRKGFKKFVIETISGWFSSVNPRLNKGVNITRTIDKEKKWYDHVVKDANTGEIIHEEHEPLDEHKSKKSKN